MLKLEIALDDNKILQERHYNLRDIYEYIDCLFASKGLAKDKNAEGTVIYTDTGAKNDLSNIFICVFHLEKQEWFMRYVTKWLFINTYNGKSEQDFDVIDIIAKNYPDRKSIAV